MTKQRGRRYFLLTAGAVGSGLLAGCQFGRENTDQSEVTTDTPSETRTATSTDTPTDTATATPQPDAPFQNWQDFKDFYRFNNRGTRDYTKAAFQIDGAVTPTDLRRDNLNKDLYRDDHRNTQGQLNVTRQVIQKLEDNMASIDQSINQGLSDIGIPHSIDDVDRLSGQVMEQVAKYAGALSMDTVEAAGLVDWYLQQKGFTHGDYRINEVNYAVGENASNSAVIIDRRINDELKTDVWGPRGDAQADPETKGSDMYLRSDETPETTVESNVSVAFDSDGDYTFARSNLRSMMHNAKNSDNPIDTKYITDAMKSILPGDPGNPFENIFDDVYMTAEAGVLSEVIMDPFTEYDSSHIDEMQIEVFNGYELDVDTLSTAVGENDQDMLRWELQDAPGNQFHEDGRNTLLDAYNAQNMDGSSILISVNEAGLQFNMMDVSSIEEHTTLGEALQAS